MSVPGLLAPVDYEGRKLVDGGLVENLPISEVRATCKADVIIAVNVGSPLLKPEAIGSLISVSAQMIGILTEQNVSRALASLQGRDVLLNPDLEGIGSGDFALHAEAADRGRAAATAVLNQLSVLAVSPARYAAWWERIGVARRQSPRIDAIVRSCRFFLCVHVVPGVLPETVSVLGGHQGQQRHAGLVTPNPGQLWCRRQAVGRQIAG